MRSSFPNSWKEEKERRRRRDFQEDTGHARRGTRPSRLAGLLDEEQKRHVLVAFVEVVVLTQGVCGVGKLGMRSQRRLDCGHGLRHARERREREVVVEVKLRGEV